MLIVGLSGGPNPLHDRSFPESSGFMHDAAAVLVRDGVLVAAAEEERFVRVKHTVKCPAHALRHCLSVAGVSASDVEGWAYYLGEDYVRRIIGVRRLDDPSFDCSLSPRELITSIIRTSTGVDIDPARVHFVPHQIAHAVSAYEVSGFSSALAVSYDGGGDDGHGRVFSVHEGRYEPVRILGSEESLGRFYLFWTKLLGYRVFDEYKVMGLAPYGNADRFLPALRTMYTLKDGGRFEILWGKSAAFASALTPRRAGAPFTQDHKDLAAAAQCALEELGLHLVDGCRQQTGQRHLCLAGGVALNCTLNGRLARLGWFDDIFVQPAAHDAGAALGAALHTYRTLAARPPVAPLQNVCLGSDCGDDEVLGAAFTRWRDFLHVERVNDIAAAAARLLAGGAVIGWMQGRSEFGPRALGNRSILADPRPAANKDRINAMVKKREAYRPFGPSVMLEHIGEYFQPCGVSDANLAYMTFAVPVHPDKRQELGAVTHVDGTARVQAVAYDTNPRFWRLIDEFRKLTAVPVLLNTSFNSHREPIVESVEDAIVCFLTTGLDYLVAGNFIATRTGTTGITASLIPAIPRHMALCEVRHHTGPQMETRYLLRAMTGTFPDRELSWNAHRLLQKADGRTCLGQLCAADTLADVSPELFDLWRERYVQMTAQ